MLPAWVWSELLVDLVDEVEVEVEQSAHERGHEQEVLLAVGKLPGRAFGVGDAQLDVGDVVAEGAHARA